MIYINEFLPNPIGSDATGEWVELYNNGPALNLAGWSLKRENGQNVSLSGYNIGEKSYLVLKRTDTKLNLVNQDGKLFLYNTEGKVVDEAGFRGLAPQGESLGRIGENFLFSNPTPGFPNSSVGKTAILKDSYAYGLNLNQEFGTLGFMGIALGSAAILGAFFIFILKKNENLSDLFFKRD